MKGKSRVGARRANTGKVLVTSCVIVGVVGLLGLPLDIVAALIIGTVIGIYGLPDGKTNALPRRSGQKGKKNVGK